MKRKDYTIWLFVSLLLIGCLLTFSSLYITPEAQITINPTAENSLQEKIFYHEHSNGHKTIQHLSYNSDTLIGPSCKRHKEEVVPRVVYYVIFVSEDTYHGKHMKFEFTHAISILSAHTFARPDHIYVVGNWEPNGQHWDWVKTQVPELEHLHYDMPKYIHGIPLAPKVRGYHASDTVRLKLLLEHGGIYMDTDAIAVNPLDELLHYDFSIGELSGGAEFGNGILFSRPNATFMKIWLDAYKSYAGEWNIFSTIFPMQMSKYFKHLMHIEKTSFYKPDSNEKPLLFQKHYDVSKNYFIHVWWGARPQTVEETKGWNATIGDVYRKVIFGSSDLKEKPIPWHIICNNKVKKNTGCRRATPEEREKLTKGLVKEEDLP